MRAPSADRLGQRVGHRGEVVAALGQPRHEHAGQAVAGAHRAPHLHRHARDVGVHRPAQQRAVGAEADHHRPRAGCEQGARGGVGVPLAGEDLGLLAVAAHEVRAGDARVALFGGAGDARPAVQAQVGVVEHGLAQRERQVTCVMRQAALALAHERIRAEEQAVAGLTASGSRSATASSAIEIASP